MFLKFLTNFFFLSVIFFDIWRSKVLSLGSDANTVRIDINPHRAMTVPMRNNEEGIEGL